MASQSAWDVVYAQDVVDFILQEITSRRVYEKVDTYRHILSEFPEIGAAYNPRYDAAMPPFPCRYVVVQGTPFVMYYAADEARRRINVFCIEDQRRNPRTRFSGMW